MRTVQERLKKQTEDRVEGHLTKVVKAHGGITIKLPAVWYAGIPDRMVLLPGGKVLFAELKRPIGGVFEKLQPLWIRKLRNLGFAVHVWHTKGSIDAYFEGLL